MDLIWSYQPPYKGRGDVPRYVWNYRDFAWGLVDPDIPDRVVRLVTKNNRRVPSSVKELIYAGINWGLSSPPGVEVVHVTGNLESPTKTYPNHTDWIFSAVNVFSWGRDLSESLRILTIDCNIAGYIEIPQNLELCYVKKIYVKITKPLSAIRKLHCRKVKFEQQALQLRTLVTEEPEIIDFSQVPSLRHFKFSGVKMIRRQK